jgi:hypothetical protein
MTAYRSSFINALQNAGISNGDLAPQPHSRRFRRPKSHWLVLSVLVVLTGTMLSARSFAAAPQSNIVSSNGSCLQVDEEDSGLSVRACDQASKVQSWQISDDGTIRNNDKCLDVATMKGPALPIAYAAKCDKSATQQWKVDDKAKHIVSGQSDNCLHNVFNGAGANSRIVVAACREAEQQQWTVREAGQASSAPVPVPAAASQTTPAPTTPATAPSPVPSPAPAVTNGNSPSGAAVPVGDISGWKQVFYDDFTKDAAIGSWGSECDGDATVYTGTQGQKWKSYPTCYKDTYQKRPYRADQVLSVKGGYLNFYLHNVNGQPAGANPSPVLNGGSQYQTYGRYTARMKVDTPSLKEYHIAWLLWPQSGVWPAGGEEDFPEGSLAEDVGGFHHYSGSGACVGCQDAASSNFKYTDWHTYTMEWMPGHVRYLVDDKAILDSTKYVPDGPMRWQLQTETNGSGNNAGNLMVDWVAVYSYQK